MSDAAALSLVKGGRTAMTEADTAQALRILAWSAFATVARKRAVWCLVHRPWEAPGAVRDWLQARRYLRSATGPAPASLASFLAGDEGGRW